MQDIIPLSPPSRANKPKRVSFRRRPIRVSFRQQTPGFAPGNLYSVRDIIPNRQPKKRVISLLNKTVNPTLTPRRPILHNKPSHERDNHVNLTGGFRDVPYLFANTDTSHNFFGQQNNSTKGTLIKPQRKLLMPFLPISHTPWQRTMMSPKKLLINIGALALVFGLVSIAFGQLRGFGRGLPLLLNNNGPIKAAYHQLISASSALADTDFVASEKHFSQAAILLNDAQNDLNEVMASSAHVLRYLDFSGTVRSGEELLAAGEHLSLAGQSISRGIETIFSRVGDKTFVASIQAAVSDLSLGVSELEIAQGSLNKVDSPILPQDIQLELNRLKAGIPIVVNTLRKILEQNATLLSMLGDKRDRQYLLVFQNNHEIRPTGGFIGSIGLVKIDRGAVEDVDITSVYDPDGQLEKAISPPEPLQRITNQWYLRDANWFVDWPTSARKIIEFFEYEKGPTVDGVIALTPEVIRQLLTVTGPITVPGYGVTVNNENFWDITQDQVSYAYDKELNKPKQFLADLTPLLLNQLFTKPADNALQVMDVLVSAMKQKNILVYFNHQELQTQLSDLGWAGQLPVDEPGFLAVNNANIGGHKSDQFIEQEIDYRLEMNVDGAVDGIVTVRRTHRGPQEAGNYPYPEGENPALKDNIVWQRVLVPEGSRLLEASGFTPAGLIPQRVNQADHAYLQADPDLANWQTGQITDSSGTTIGRESGYAFFANWLVTRPGATSMALYRYRLPDTFLTPNFFDQATKLTAYVYKQPGDSRTKLSTEIKIPRQFKIIHTVPALGTELLDDQTLIHHTALVEDFISGVVIVRRSD